MQQHVTSFNMKWDQNFKFYEKCIKQQLNVQFKSMRMRNGNLTRQMMRQQWAHDVGYNDATVVPATDDA